MSANAQSRTCGKTGHIAPVCRSKASKTPSKKLKHKPKTHHVHKEPEESSNEDEFKLKKLDKRSIIVQMKVNGTNLDMEVDTGAALSVISETTRRAVFLNDTLHPSSLILKTYTDEQMEVTGTLNVNPRL